ncbi:hypothetical protein JQC92_20265 [Shewanella sp. 202IG2-18]|uniref:hypothetical protein n=1 Tax=Parashewanella hymeniacidonis TaxID=2807618 RepID=UPI0019619C45|nr:hypothetical protein [Parashewanella hymeniacidonis]MBM7074329.1 hypothetical protein [Parashewanella hymeniacidonis]
MSFISTRTIKENILAHLEKSNGAMQSNTVLKLSNDCKYKIKVIESDSKIEHIDVSQERSNRENDSNNWTRRIARAFSKYFYFSATNRLKRTLNHTEVKAKLSEFNKKPTSSNRNTIVIGLKSFWGFDQFFQPRGPS